MNSNQKKANVQKGREYEKLAARFYESRGYKIIERNWTAGHKEIDLIARKDNCIVIVEVKASRSLKFGHPSERVDRKKRRNLIEAAEQYIITNDIKGCDFRFDLVTFLGGKLEHYPDAFQKEE